jgi:3-methyladenine DNA glycosylase AlkD
MLIAIHRAVRKEANAQKALLSQRFFKTGKGEYAEGDRFLGLTVPQSRRIVRAFPDASFADAAALLESPFHEERFIALQLFVEQFARGDEKVRKQVVAHYLRSTRFINNWDLVDGSAPYILGAYLCDHPRDMLYTLARSRDLWKRRIAIVATLAFIRRNECDDTFAIATLLLRDPHDLIHKATGWMLREVGKRDRARLISFLDQHAAAMPRTMLRYAIEHFDPTLRKYYLAQRAMKS